MKKILAVSRVYLSKIMGEKTMAVKAFLSSMVCVVAFLGTAQGLAPSNQYEHFSDARYITWEFKQPLQLSVIYPRVNALLESGFISGAHVVCDTAYEAIAKVGIYGLDNKQFFSAEMAMHGEVLSSGEEAGFLIDRYLVPAEFNTRLDHLTINIEGRELPCLGLAPDMMYGFPDTALDAFDPVNIDIMFKDNRDFKLRLGKEPPGLEQGNEPEDEAEGYKLEYLRANRQYIYLPLWLYADLGLKTNVIRFTFDKAYTPQDKVLLSDLFHDVAYKDFHDPNMQGWTQGYTQGVQTTRTVMLWLLIPVLAAMVNLLILWQIWVKSFRKELVVCHLLGLSVTEQRIALGIITFLWGLISLLAATVVFAVFHYVMEQGGFIIGSVQFVLSIGGLMYGIGLLVYNWICIRRTMGPVCRGGR